MLKADHLIDFQSRRWDRNKLQEIFVPGDVNSVMKKQPMMDFDDLDMEIQQEWGLYSQVGILVGN